MKTKFTIVCLALYSAVLAFADNKTNTVETVCWGERANGLQLSISAITSVITTSDKLMVHFRARNLSADRMHIDAAIPSGNGSRIDVVHPDGSHGGLNVWADRIMSTVLVPGENDLGVYDVTGALDKLEYNAKKEGDGKYDRRRLPGVHKITWVLRETRSNSIDIKLE